MKYCQDLRLSKFVPGSNEKFALQFCDYSFRGKVVSKQLTLIAEKRIRKSDVKKAENLLIEILDLNVEDRDSIETVFQAFPISRVDKTKEAFFTLSFVNLAVLLASVIALTFLFSYRRMQKKQLSAMKEMGAANQSNNSDKDEKQDDDSSNQETPQSVTEIEMMKHFFGFVTHDNFDNFLDVIKKESLSNQHLSVIIACLNPSIASKILNEFPSDKQSDIVKSLVKQKNIEKSTLEKMEALIKGRMESLIGGSRVVTEILNEVTNANKKKILNEIKKDPAAFAEIRPNVLLIDDIVHLKDDEVKLIISELSMDVLSNLMISVEQKNKKIKLHKTCHRQQVL